MQPIRVLYAGTGPYGTLIIPLLPLYKENEIIIDLLDVNDISIRAISKLIEKLGLQKFVGRTYLMDATSFCFETDYDIVISETMQNALKNEPQVAIMQNLIPQMKKDSVFIPEAITLRAALVSKGKWDSEKLIYNCIEVSNDKEIFTVDKLHLDTEGYRNQIEIFDPVGNINKLELYTIIRVFDDEILKDSDCSLTLPLKVCELDKEQIGVLQFWYEQGTLPGVRCKIIGIEKVYEAIGTKKIN